MIFSLVATAYYRVKREFRDNKNSIKSFASIEFAKYFLGFNSMKLDRIQWQILLDTNLLKS
jgi:DNA topoisomerase IB